MEGKGFIWKKLSLLHYCVRLVSTLNFVRFTFIVTERGTGLKLVTGDSGKELIRVQTSRV